MGCDSYITAIILIYYNIYFVLFSDFCLIFPLLFILRISLYIMLCFQLFSDYFDNFMHFALDQLFFFFTSVASVIFIFLSAKLLFCRHKNVLCIKMTKLQLPKL